MVKMVEMGNARRVGAGKRKTQRRTMRMKEEEERAAAVRRRRKGSGLELALGGCGVWCVWRGAFITHEAR